MSDRPAAEVHVDAALISRLLADQHPDLARLEVRVVAEGWDNVIARLGTELAVRMPRRSLAAQLIEHEAVWLPVLAPGLPLPIPVPLRTGTPALEYPWSWAVVPWFEGGSAAVTPLVDPLREARRLGEFLARFHRPAPPDAPENPFRGIPLALRDRPLRNALDGVLPGARGGNGQRRTALEVWAQALAASPWPGPPNWVHGDLHPANLVVRRGQLAAVIDFGDLTAGDPACDLATGWMLFDRAGREELLAAAGHAGDEAMVARARGWALTLALAHLSFSADDPVIVGIGRRTFAATLAG